jgi:aconitate hydratase
MVVQGGLGECGIDLDSAAATLHHRTGGRMKGTIAGKIIEEHLVEGSMTPGTEIGIRIDQTLTQDATGTMAYLQFEAMGIPRVRTKLSMSYIDHNTLQSGFENADDHAFLQSVAAKYGIYFSRPGNGICHQVHLERFGVPGMTLLGSDSHTPTGGGIGMLAIGAGGLDVAAAMGGAPFFTVCPKVFNVYLTGKLSPWVTAKDVILEVLRRLSVKGGVGRVMEYTGPGVATLSVPERATITNMGAELGATSSVFPSDETTRAFLRFEKREDAYRELLADPGAEYEDRIEIDLSKLEPLIAQPHNPDNVVPVREIAGMRVHQVAVGSCTNSSYNDLVRVAKVLKGRKIHPNCSMVISPGSRQVFEMIARDGYLADLIASGVRMLEATCGPCIGMGQAPRTGGVSVRSFNRNFLGRSGTKDASVYLASPEVCAACAVTGIMTDPRDLGEYPVVDVPKEAIVDDGFVIPPSDDPASVEIVRGPNIAPLPVGEALSDIIEAPALLKVGDNITTDHIMPAGAKILPLRSNIPKIAEHVYTVVDETFPARAKEAGRSVIVGGENYGQGSSREHAALAPMYLGVKAVIAKSFARIHRANLVNFGIIPFEFADPADYDRIDQGDMLRIEGLRSGLASGVVTVTNTTKGRAFEVKATLSDRQRELLAAGGLLNFIKSRA